MCWAARPGLMLTGIIGFTASASAQNWPTKPVRIVVPFGPGGPADIYARIVGQELTGALGQQFLTENTAGAGGEVAGPPLATAAPAGHTVLLRSNPPPRHAPLRAHHPL